MDLAYYYSVYLPSTLPFFTSQGQFKTLADNAMSDQEIIECISNFVVKNLGGFLLNVIDHNASSVWRMTAVHPSHEYNNVEVVDTTYAKGAVRDFLVSQGVVAGTTVVELTNQLRGWYKNLSEGVANIYRSFILAAAARATSVPITFPADIKNAIKGLGKLYAEEDITCSVELEGQPVELIWEYDQYHITVNSAEVINSSMVDADIFMAEYTQSGFGFGGHIGQAPTIPSEEGGYNMLMIKNLITSLCVPVAYLCYREINGVRTPVRFDSFELSMGYDPSVQKMYYSVYGYVNSEDMTNENCTLLTYTREYIPNNHVHPQGLPTYDQLQYVSEPYDDTYYYRNASSGSFTRGGLFNTVTTKYDFVPNTAYGCYMGTIYLESSLGFFDGMTEEELYDEESYIMGTYIRNNINTLGETYAYPMSVDPALKQKLISDEYDIIGSGNSVDAGTRSGEGVTVVTDPASIGTIADVYPATDVLAEAVNVYPVDLAEDKVIADNPAEAISVPDAAIAIDAANNASGVAEGIPPVELVSATGRYGMFTLYKVTTSQLTALSSKLWSSDFLDNFHPFKTNPSEALISLMAYPMDINSSGSDSAIICGNYDCSPASGKVVSNLFNTKTLGSVTIPEKFNNFLDYSPYTTVNLFLPFIGFVELDVDEVMGATISVFYRVEVITGTCVACVKVKKGTMDAILYQYAGNMGITLPLSGSDFSRVYSLLATAGAEVLGGLITGNGVSMAAAAGFAGQAVASKPPVHKTGGLGGNSGMCGNLAPYVVINTVIPDTPDGYKALKGKPTNRYLRVGDLQGFVQLDRFYLNIPDVTDEEKIELENLLKEGIFI